MSPLDAPAPKTQKVLLVDDDATFRRYLEVQLEMLGCQIVSLENGEAAWAQIQIEAPDLVLTDVFMPGMSGVELCQRIKSAPDLAGIPVVLLTMAGPKAKDEGYKAGADDFLNKPPHLAELRARLHNLLLLSNYQAARVPEPPSSTAAASEEAMPVPAGRPRVLMLESYGILRGFVEQILVEQDMDFAGASTVDQFFEELRERQPDLAIIDQDLMEGPGSALVSRLRNLAATSELPVLLMCENSALAPDSEAWTASADEHLVKPFEAPELKTRVRALLQHAKLHHRHDPQRFDTDASALRDPASGAFARPFLLASLDALCAFAAQCNQPVSLLAYQLPDGKRPGATDLRRVASTIQSQLNPHEFLCRASEQVFVAILPGVDAFQLASRAMALAHKQGGGHIASVSAAGPSGTALLRQLWGELLKHPGA